MVDDVLTLSNIRTWRRHTQQTTAHALLSLKLSIGGAHTVGRAAC